jgi:alpha-beta hydrolase superfamily lysophospholipase
MNIEKTTFSFYGNEKATINVISWIPETAIKGVIIIVHGMADYADRYDEFARFLAQNQYAVYAHDQRGHGSSMTDGKMGFFAKKNGWDLILSDLHNLIRITQEKHPESPTLLFGHSMGSLLARTYAIDYGKFIHKLIICGTATDPGLMSSIGLVLAKTLSFLCKPESPSRLLTMLTFAGANKTYKNRRTKFDFISRDPDMVDKYKHDPLCGFLCSNSFYVDMLTGVKYINHDQNVSKIPSSLPILMISGDDDPVGDYGKGVEKVYRQLKANGCADVTLKLYPGARHELVNETNRKEIFEDVLNWMNKRYTVHDKWYMAEPPLSCPV